MARTAVGITKTEIERVLKGALAGGFKPGRLEVEGRKIVIYAIDMRLVDDASPLDKWRQLNGEG